ncbi:MAG: serine/threonine protein kinase, partial [Cyanobacteria bacterium]|nr:serine/threonine protein kinase [Cyanobacteriota bacterium]
MTNTSERVVDNRYRVIKKVGQGNMGEVYQCQDTQLECVVAVKLLAGDAPEDDVVRFQREAKATAKLNHQNILKVRDFKRSNDGRLYLVMDFLEGESLADYIERNIQDKGRKDPEEILDILEQICSALEHSHESGILHRDVKPTNIILSKGTDGLDAKIIDFGIAKLRQIDHTLTKAGLSVGTPAYMSPEAVRGEELEERSDIYSFGVMMYELLSDKKPFSGENNLETMLMHLHKTAAPLKESGVGEQFGPYLLRLEQIVSRCLAKEKDSRFGSFAEVQAALEKCVPQSSANLTPVSTARGGRSMSVPLVSIGISVLVCILGLVLTKVMNNGQSAKPTSRPGEKSNVERVRELTRSSPTYRAA